MTWCLFNTPESNWLGCRYHASSLYPTNWLKNQPSVHPSGFVLAPDQRYSDYWKTVNTHEWKRFQCTRVCLYFNSSRQCPVPPVASLCSGRVKSMNIMTWNELKTRIVTRNVKQYNIIVHKKTFGASHLWQVILKWSVCLDGEQNVRRTAIQPLHLLFPLTPSRKGGQLLGRGRMW